MSAEDSDHRLADTELEQRSNRVLLEYRRGAAQPDVRLVGQVWGNTREYAEAKLAELRAARAARAAAELQRDLVRRSLHRRP